MKPVRAEWGPSLGGEWGWACIGCKIRPWLPGYKDRPRGAEWGRVGPVRAEWGWGGVGHALGFNYMTARLGPAARAGSGRVGPSRAG